MTASVGNASARGVDSLLQSGTPKIPGAGLRRQAVHQDDANAQSEDVTQNLSSTEPDALRSRVDHAGKVSKREPGKEDKKSDDGSFEDTFKSMGENSPKDANAPSASYPAGFLLVQPGSATIANVDPAQSSPDGSAAIMRSTTLSKQKSIMALMDTNDRFFTNQDAANTDGATAGEALPEHAEMDGDEVPLSVDRQEVHWNFNNDVVASTTAKVSALQIGAHFATPFSKQPSLSNASAIPESKTSDIRPQDTSPQAVAISDSGQSANAALSGGGDGAPSDSQLKNGAASPAEGYSKSARTDASSSIDQLLSTTAVSSQNQQSVSTQVRDGVVNSLSTNGPDSGASTTTTMASNRPTTAAVMRTLDLTLSPPDLGSVKLRLSLKSNSLSIEAEATKASTAKLLSDDRTNLERGLRDAGYDISSMKITDTSASSSSNAGGWQQGSAQARDGEQSRSAFNGRQDGEMQRRDGSTSDQSQRRQRQESPQQAAETPGARPSSAVYI